MYIYTVAVSQPPVTIANICVIAIPQAPPPPPCYLAYLIRKFIR